MGVLTLYVGSDARASGTIVVETALARALHGGQVGIHRAGDIGPGAVAFIVGEACLVESLDGLLHSLEVVAAAALVAIRPEADAGMVAERQHMTLVALHHCRLEGCNARQSHVAVTLHIGLGKHIHAVLVAHLIEIRIVRIVTGANGIDVQLLHQKDVALGLLAAHRTSVLGAEVMTVDAMEDDALAVDGQSAIGTNGNLADAYLASTHIEDLVALTERDHQVVEVRFLSTPQARIADTDTAKRQLLGLRHGLALLSHNGSAIHDFHLYLPVGERLALYVDGYRGSSNGVGGAKRGGEEVIANLRLRSRPQEYFTCDTGQSPIVLTFQERTTGEAIDTHGDIVASGTHKIGYPELRRQVGVLGIAGKLAIHPDVVAMSGTVEAHVDIASCPRLRQVEVAAVGAHRVLLRAAIGPVGRSVGHHAPRVGVIGEGVHDVHIQRLVPVLAVTHAVDLPRGRHVDVIPA